jgi:hypothetical protein
MRPSGALGRNKTMTKQKVPRLVNPGATRPQATRLQPVVRNVGIRNVRKPKAKAK